MIKLKDILQEIQIDRSFDEDLIDAINDEYMEDYQELTPKEINNGYCDMWARQFVDRFGGEHQWSYDFPDFPNSASGHSWVSYQGKFYDAEIPDGVNQLEDIPYFKRAIEHVGNADWIDDDFRSDIQTSGTSPCND